MISLSIKIKLISVFSLLLKKTNIEYKIIKNIFKFIAEFPKIKLTGKKDINRLENRWLFKLVILLNIIVTNLYTIK
tara:strand:- start:229 stop:456 length:228 start_codon:yes stop_codon:yes gene_type:complete